MRPDPAVLCRVLLVGGLSLGLWAVMPEDREPVTTQAVSQETVQEGARRLRRHVERLCSPPDRSWRRPEVLGEVARWIRRLWEGQGYRVAVQAIPDMGPDYVNIVARPAGSGSEGRPVTWIVAHYDTVEGTPGADDNASGVAVLLETARLVAGEAGLPVGFAAVTLEEPPFFETPQQGGWVLARSLYRERSPVAAALVLEMVGCYESAPGTQKYPFPVGLLGFPSRGDFVGLVANRASRRILGPLGRAIASTGLPVQTLAVPGKGKLLAPVRFSDHAAFWDLGYRALMVTDTAFYRNPRYHGPDDTPDTLDYVSMARLARGLARYLRDQGSSGGR